jgi:hypothetical protein
MDVLQQGLLHIASGVDLNRGINLSSSNNNTETGSTGIENITDFREDYARDNETQRQHLPSSVNQPRRQTPGRKPRKNFLYRLKEVKAFKEKHGHCMIPHKYKDNPSLGTWTDTQRRRYRKTLEARKLQAGEADPPANSKRSGGLFISQEHIDQLEAVGFLFEPRLSRKETWERRVQELKAFKKVHGHCNVREDDNSNPGLGKWISYVRRTYRLSKQKKNGGKGNKKLTDERIMQLKNIGFVFELKEEMAMQRFKDAINGLKEFREKIGHLRVPTFYPENPTFGLCVEEMRVEYRKILKSIEDGGNAFSDGMNADIVKELNEMGFLSEDGQSELPVNKIAANDSLELHI